MTPVEDGGVIKCSIGTAEGHATVLYLKDSTRGERFEGAGEDGGDVFEAVH